MPTLTSVFSHTVLESRPTESERVSYENIRRDTPTMEKPTLRGRLESFRLYDLLTLLNISNKSGTLVIEEGSKETRIIFRKGALRFAHSNQERFRLGAILR